MSILPETLTDIVNNLAVVTLGIAFVLVLMNRRIRKIEKAREKDLERFQTIEISMSRWSYTLSMIQDEIKRNRKLAEQLYQQPTISVEVRNSLLCIKADIAEIQEKISDTTHSITIDIPPATTAEWPNDAA